MHLFCSIGERIDQKSAGLYILDMVERRILTAREGKIVNMILSIMDDDYMRAEALKKTVLAAV